MLRPNPQPFLQNQVLLWLTDQEMPDRAGLGLTSKMLDCDRLAFRYIVEADDARPFKDIASISAFGWMILESAAGARPETWWVVDHAVLGVLDRHYAMLAEREK